MAEKVGFEPTVPLLVVRVFSKDLVSATHPLLRTKNRLILLNNFPILDKEHLTCHNVFTESSLAVIHFLILGFYFGRTLYLN